MTTGCIVIPGSETVGAPEVTAGTLGELEAADATGGIVVKDGTLETFDA